MKAVCIRCGKCCGVYWGRDRKYRCPHMAKTDGKTLCRIYNSRLGKITHVIDGKEFDCILREKTEFDYEGCPLNTNKPILTGWSDVMKMFPKETKKYR